MRKSIILVGAAIGIVAASSAGAKATHSGWRGTIDGYFATGDKRICRWDAPPGGGPACRVIEMHEQGYSHGSPADKLNGWKGKEEIRFDAVYYNGQLWTEAYDAFVIFVRTRDGWQLRYSSMGNGENGAATGAAVR